MHQQHTVHAIDPLVESSSLYNATIHLNSAANIQILLLGESCCLMFAKANMATFVNPLVSNSLCSGIVGHSVRKQVSHKFAASVGTIAAPPLYTFSENTVCIGMAQVGNIFRVS
jgi:hypothetical protein